MHELTAFARVWCGFDGGGEMCERTNPSKYDSCKLFRFKAIAKTFTNQMGTRNNDLRAKIAAV